MLYPILVVEGLGAHHIHNHYHLGRKKVRDRLGLVYQFCDLMYTTKHYPLGPHSKLFDSPVQRRHNASIMAAWVTEDEHKEIEERLIEHHAEYRIYEIDIPIMEKLRWHFYPYERVAFDRRHEQAIERTGDAGRNGVSQGAL